MIFYLADYDASKIKIVKQLEINEAIKIFIIKRIQKLNEAENYKRQLENLNG